MFKSPAALIRVARRAANRLFVHRPHFPAAEPFSDEFVRNQQDSRRRAGNLPGSCWPCISPPARSLRRRSPAKPGYEIAVKAGSSRQEPRRRGAAPTAVRSRPLLATASVRARRADRQAMPSSATICRRARAPRSAPTFTASSDARRVRAGLQLFGGVEGQGRHLDVRRAQHVADQAERLRSRHGHDLRRPGATRNSAPT